MSGAGAVQAQIDAAVQSAVSPLLVGMAALTARVAELEAKLEKPPAKKAAVTRAGTASVATEAQDTK